VAHLVAPGREKLHELSGVYRLLKKVHSEATLLNMQPALHSPLSTRANVCLAVVMAHSGNSCSICLDASSVRSRCASPLGFCLTLAMTLRSRGRRVQVGWYGQVVEHYKRTHGVLRKYSSIPSFGTILQECDEIVATLRIRLRHVLESTVPTSPLPILPCPRCTIACTRCNR
jgi:hypothetical protein